MDQDTASADKLGRVLSGAGDTVAVLHGSRSLSRRRAAREGFQRGTFRVLVPTDIAARGFDVADIGHVDSFDQPDCPEVYASDRAHGAHATSLAGDRLRDGRRPRPVAPLEKLLEHPVSLVKGGPAPVAVSARREDQPTLPRARCGMVGHA